MIAVLDRAKAENESSRSRENQIDSGWEDFEDSIFPTLAWLKRFQECLSDTEHDKHIWRKATREDEGRAVEILRLIVIAVGYRATPAERAQMFGYKDASDVGTEDMVVEDPIVTTKLWFESRHEEGLQQAKLLKIYAQKCLAQFRRLEASLEHLKGARKSPLFIGSFEWPLKMEEHQQVLKSQIADLGALASYYSKISNGRWSAENDSGFSTAVDLLQSKFECSLPQIHSLLNWGFRASGRPEIELTKLRDRITSSRAFAALNPDLQPPKKQEGQ